jgi:hypothetical protein
MIPTIEKDVEHHHHHHPSSQQKNNNNNNTQTDSFSISHRSFWNLDDVNTLTCSGLLLVGTIFLGVGLTYSVIRIVAYNTSDSKLEETIPHRLVKYILGTSVFVFVALTLMCCSFVENRRNMVKIMCSMQCKRGAVFICVLIKLCVMGVMIAHFLLN